MPLDSSLFNDLIEANGHAVVSTRGMPNAYSMDTPDNAWRTMVDMWRSRAITSTRIIQDIDKTVRAMDAIIAALGTIVEDYDCRNGHRKRQARLCLAGMMHPDCEKAMQAQSQSWAGEPAAGFPDPVPEEVEIPDPEPEEPEVVEPIPAPTEGARRSQRSGAGRAPIRMDEDPSIAKGGSR